jgi:hypothetical protein
MVRRVPNRFCETNPSFESPKPDAICDITEIIEDLVSLVAGLRPTSDASDSADRAIVSFGV